MENTTTPKAAVITIYYNRPNHIKESIQSLKDQTYENLDIIIVDDCSKDDTYSKLKEHAGDDGRIKLFRNEQNKGFTKTIIDTIAGIDAKYIAIHGSGDISMPTRIEEQVNYFERNTEVGVLTTDLLNAKQKMFNKTEITTQDLIIKNRVTHGAVMFRLSDYLKVGGYRGYFTSRQDKDLWCRMSLITKIHFLPKKMYKLVKIQDSVSQTASISGTPTLISGFVTYLIKERMATGTDSLDVMGDKAALFFNPSTCNKLYYTNIKRSLKKRNFKAVNDYITILIKINSNMLHLGFLQLFKGLIKIIK